MGAARCRRTLLAILLGVSVHAAPGWSLPVPTADASYDALYLVVTVTPSGALETVYAAPVKLQGSRPPAHAAQAVGRASRDTAALSVRVRDAHGAVLFEDRPRVSRWLRSETAGATNGDGAVPITSHRIETGTRAFAVRVPLVPGARVSLASELAQEPLELHLDDFVGRPAARGIFPGALRALPAAATPVVRGGDPGNRLDVLIVAEGYTEAERAKFDTDAATLVAGFFDGTPLREYRNYVNVATLFVASNQSGADQPAYVAGCPQFSRVQSCCGDTTAFGLTTDEVDTAFDATFCSFNVERALTVDASKVLIAAAAEPDWDVAMVLVNTARHGGTGDEVVVLSADEFVATTAVHEQGHVFARLADEYADPAPGFGECSDVSLALPPCEPNVTDVTSRNQIKWRRWIAPTQAVPSFGPPPVATDAGLWEGARYLASDMYRQGFECLMRFLNAPFCDVAAEAFATRFYESGWGIPVNGIDNVEPGSESPPAGPVVLPSGDATFSATVLGPEAGPELAVAWYVDTALVATASAPNGGRIAQPLALAPGLHSVELRVTDTSPIIHDSIRDTVTSVTIWAATVDPDDSVPCGDADGNGSRSVSDGVQTLRAAAELTSLCVPSRCDLDGNGVVSVSDGVNVLRGAAGLPFPAACPR